MTIEQVRGIVRPVVTLSGWLTLLYLVVITDGDLRLMFVGTMATILGYWFGERKK